VSYFRNTFRLLIGVGKSHNNTVTPSQILITAIAVGFAFLGSISILLLLASLVING